MSTPKRNVEKSDRVLALRAASRTTRIFLVSFSPYQHAFQRHQETVPDNLQKENIMSNKLANLTQNSNGTFTGTLHTMNVTTKITVTPISKVLPSCLLGATALCQRYENSRQYAAPKGLPLSS